jgi:hypothetical protein
MFIFMTALEFYRHPEQQSKDFWEALWLLFYLSVCVCLGCLNGAWQWRSIERKMRELGLAE